MNNAGHVDDLIAARSGSSNGCDKTVSVAECLPNNAVSPWRSKILAARRASFFQVAGETCWGGR